MRAMMHFSRFNMKKKLLSKQYVQSMVDISLYRDIKYDFNSILNGLIDLIPLILSESRFCHTTGSFWWHNYDHVNGSR